VDWIHLTHAKNKWSPVVKVVKNFWTVQRRIIAWFAVQLLVSGLKFASYS